MGKYDNIHDTISKYKDDFQKYTHKINPLYKETLPKFIRQYIACIFDIYYLLPFYIGFKIGDIILNKVYDKILIQRDFVPKNIKKVKMPPELTVDFLVTDEIDHKYEENLQKEIDKFLNVLENNFNRESLAFFFRNIKSLDFKEMAEKENDDTLGVYNVIQNNIRLLKEDNNNTLFHELFHMASSYRDEENKISYCGFHQTKKNYDLGRGINEGYTELLANRYSDYNSHYCYYCEKKYAKIIEDIIGKELMQNLYLQANLKGLITELTKYQTTENSTAKSVYKKLCNLFKIWIFIINMKMMKK